MRSLKIQTLLVAIVIIVVSYWWPRFYPTAPHPWVLSVLLAMGGVSLWCIHIRVSTCTEGPNWKDVRLVLLEILILFLVCLPIVEAMKYEEGVEMVVAGLPFLLGGLGTTMLLLLIAIDAYLRRTKNSSPTYPKRV